GGGLRLRLTGNVNHSFSLTGQLSGPRLTGSFTEQGRAFAFTESSAEKFTCSTGTVRFTLHG
ncbi:MAG TPA: hypothetical protein VGK33_08225, partial [Chloroflexota bacterium]